MNSKFCGQCGTSNAAGSSLCLSCGMQFENITPHNNFNAQAGAYSSNQPLANNSQPSFQPPANNFTPPQFRSDLQEPRYYQPEKKSGIGSKIMSVLGVLAVGLFFILKFGFVLIRASRLGGIALVGVVFLVIVGFGVFGFIRKR